MKFNEVLKESPSVTIDEFARTLRQLFTDERGIDLNIDFIKGSIKKGAIMSTPDNMVPRVELKRFQPSEFVTMTEFIKEANIDISVLKDLMIKGIIQGIQTEPVLIHRNFLRQYCRNNSIQMTYDTDDLLKILDKVFESKSVQWDRDIFSRRDNKAADFLVDVPDENVPDYVNVFKIKIDDVLELGCGQGRNGIFLAKKGARVDAIDKAKAGIEWATENATKENVNINFYIKSIFDFDPKGKTYDLVYDGGCLHHIPPHRRKSYKDLVVGALKPHGHLGIVFFNRVLHDHTDLEIYKNGSTRSGVPYTRGQMELMFGEDFNIIEFRQMREHYGNLYGRDYLSTVLLQRKY